MSVQAISWAIKVRVGDPTLKVLLIAIANYANRENVCWYTQAALAHDSEISDRTVRRALVKLRDAGFIETEQRKRSDGGNGTITIRLLMDKMSGGGPDNSCPEVPDIAVSGGTGHMVSGPYEPSIEPSIEPKTLVVSDDDRLPDTIAKPDFGKIFDDRFKPIYPKRDGGLNAAKGRDVFIGLCKKGTDPEAIIAGLQRYAAWAQATGKVGTELVAMITTWLNGKRWTEDYSSTGTRNNTSGSAFFDQTIQLNTKGPNHDDR